MRISIYNAKGGTSKTTSAVNLSHALAIRGSRVLLVDCDPQASSAFHFGIGRNSLNPSLADVLIEGVSVEKVIRKTGIQGVDVITGSLNLSTFDVLAANSKGREYLLRDSLKSVDYDFVIFDAAPTMGLLSLNVLAACEGILIPTPPHFLAFQGLLTLEQSLEEMKGMGICPEVLGIVLTMVDRRVSATDEAIKLLRTHYKKAVFKTEIPTNAPLSVAPSHGKSVFQFDSKGRGARAYRELADELLKKIRLRKK